MSERSFFLYLIPGLAFSTIFFLYIDTYIYGELVVGPHQGARIIEGIVLFSFLSASIVSHFEKSESSSVLVSSSLQAGIFFSFAVLIMLSARILPRGWDSRTISMLGYKTVYSSIPNIGSWLLFLPLGLILGVSLPVRNSVVPTFFPTSRETLSPNAQNKGRYSYVTEGMIIGFISGIFFIAFLLIRLRSIFTSLLALFLGGVEGNIVKLLHKGRSQKIIYVALWTFLLMIGFPFLISLFVISFGISTSAIDFTVYFVELVPVFFVPFGQGAVTWLVTRRRHGSFIPSSDHQNQTSDISWFATSLIMLNVLFVPFTISEITIGDDELYFGHYSYSRILSASVYVPLIVATLLGMSWGFGKEELPKYLLPVIVFSFSFQMISQIMNFIGGITFVIFNSSPLSSSFSSIISYYAMGWVASVIIFIVAILVFLPLGWTIGTWTANESPNRLPYFFSFFRKRPQKKKQTSSHDSVLAELSIGVVVMVAEFIALIFTLNLRILFLVLVFSMWLLVGLSQEQRKITGIKSSFLLLCFYIMLHFVFSIFVLQLITKFQNALSIIHMTVKIILVGTMIFLLSILIAVPGYIGGIFLQVLILRLFGESTRESSEENGSLVFYDFDV